MAARTDIFDLPRLGLSSGEGRSLVLSVGLDGFTLAGQSYNAVTATTDVRLDVSRTTTGHALRLRYEVTLDGPCMRCLEPANRHVKVDAREIDQPGGGDELASPYVDAGQLDLHGWARDSLALALPVQIVCTEDCRGLCAICGANLNEAGPEHVHEQGPDPRWAKLSELRFD